MNASVAGLLFIVSENPSAQGWVQVLTCAVECAQRGKTEFSITKKDDPMDDTNGIFLTPDDVLLLQGHGFKVGETNNKFGQRWYVSWEE